MNRDIGRGEFEGVLQEAAYSHPSRLVVAKRIKTQIRRDTHFEGHARYIDRVLEPSVLNELPKAKYSEAALAALCGLQ